MNILLCILYVCLAVSGLTLIKLGSSSSNESSLVIPILEIVLSKWTFLGIMCYGMSFCIYLGVVSKFSLGLIVPLLGGIANLLILFTSYFILKEKLTVNMVIGSLIIIIGIFIMNMKK